MANREMAVAVSGVLVGVLLGAGSMLFGQDASLQAQVDGGTFAQYAPSNPRYMQKRTARRRVKARPPLSGTQLRSLRPAASEALSGVAPIEIDCATAEYLSDAVLGTMPLRRETLATYFAVSDIFDEVLSVCTY